MPRPLVTLLLLIAAAARLPAAVPPRALGRLPADSVIAIRSGRFVTSDIDDLLVLEHLGEVELAPLQGGARQSAPLRRLTLHRVSGAGLIPVWRSRIFIAGSPAAAGILPTTWAAADFDGDGRAELALITGDSCRLHSYGPDSITFEDRAIPAARPEQASDADIDSDGRAELVLLELPPHDPTGTTRLLTAYTFTADGSEPLLPAPLGLGWGPNVRPALLGSARLDDYHGRLPVIAGIHTETRPGTYAILYRNADSACAITGNPFPAAEWFSKTETLPSGPLDLDNVGDTLVACGYFVPGSRPGGPARTFARIDDGEWRVLPLTDAAARIAGPACRFTLAGVTGWLEARGPVLWFYEGEIYRWR